MSAVTLGFEKQLFDMANKTPSRMVQIDERTEEMAKQATKPWSLA